MWDVPAASGRLAAAHSSWQRVAACQRCIAPAWTDWWPPPAFVHPGSGQLPWSAPMTAECSRSADLDTYLQFAPDTKGLVSWFRVRLSNSNPNTLPLRTLRILRNLRWNKSNMAE